jgi:acetyltransferase-like isoleucine patch superfamily enzyme
MKQLIKILITKLGLIVHVIFPYKVSQKIEGFKGVIYTAWISPNFKVFGRGSKIETGIYLVNGKNIEIGTNTLIGRNSFLTALNSDVYQHLPKIIIGDNCIFGSDLHITAVNLIKIGNGTRTGKSVLISDNAHGDIDMKLMSIAPDKRPVVSKGPVIIGDNVWIGEKAAIMAGVTIGESCIIGANSVVTKDIPDYCVAVGSPAKVIKNLSKI